MRNVTFFNPIQIGLFGVTGTGAGGYETETKLGKYIDF